jgi:hypothetical protein
MSLHTQIDNIIFRRESVKNDIEKLLRLKYCVDNSHKHKIVVECDYWESRLYSPSNELIDLMISEINDKIVKLREELDSINQEFSKLDYNQDS